MCERPNFYNQCDFWTSTVLNHIQVSVFLHILSVLCYCHGAKLIIIGKICHGQQEKRKGCKQCVFLFDSVSGREVITIVLDDLEKSDC
jgi:hypothetical protein